LIVVCAKEDEKAPKHIISKKNRTLAVMSSYLRAKDGL
jgi:hypothetical protein